ENTYPLAEVREPNSRREPRHARTDDRDVVMRSGVHTGLPLQEVTEETEIILGKPISAPSASSCEIKRPGIPPGPSNPSFAPASTLRRERVELRRQILRGTVQRRELQVVLLRHL